jgi:nucleoside-diphosphate-sugar epimerase
MVDKKMHVFVTGATGFIGTAIVKELLAAGHSVIGLARSDEAAKTLEAAGAEAHRGSLSDLESLKAGAAKSDGVIHAAFIHDFTDFVESCAADRAAIAAMGEALAGTDRPLVVTSGTAVIKSGATATEDKPGDATSAGALRAPSEELTLAFAERGVRSMVLRLPPSVHGEGDHGFVPSLIGIAQKKGAAGYIGDGGNRWPAVHRLDAARLFRLVLEKGGAGTRYHGVADQGVPTREIAEIIGRRLNIPVVSKTVEEAGEHFGWLGHFFAIDNPASSTKTQAELGWMPTNAGLLSDLDSDHYFRG